MKNKIFPILLAVFLLLSGIGVKSIYASDKYYQTFRINKTWLNDSETDRPESVLFHVVDENNQSVADIRLTKNENWSKLVNIPLEGDTIRDFYIYEDPVDGYISDTPYTNKEKVEPILLGEYLLNDTVAPANSIGSVDTSGLNNVPMGSALIDGNLPLSEAVMDLPDGFIFEKDVTVVRSIGTNYESSKADRIIYTGQLPYNDGGWITLTWKNKAKDILTGNTFDLTLNIKVNSIEAVTDVDGREINIIAYHDNTLQYMSYIVCRDSTSCKYSNDADNIVGVDLITKVELSSDEHEIPKYLQLHFSDIDLPDYINAYKNNNGKSNNSYGTNFKYAEKIRIGNNTGLASDIFLSGSNSQIESNGLTFAAKTGAPNLLHDETSALTYLTKTDDIRFEWTGSFCGTAIFYNTENTIKSVKETNVNNTKIKIDTTAVINEIESTEITPAKITMDSDSPSTITVSDKVVITGLNNEQIEGCKLETNLHKFGNDTVYTTESTLDSTTKLVSFSIPFEPGQYTFVNRLDCGAVFYHNTNLNDPKETFIIEKEETQEAKEFTVSISKVKLGQTEELSGAELRVIGTGADNSDFTVSWVSGDEARTLKLKPGTYTLIEDRAPSGYDIAEPIDFEVTEEGQIIVGDNEVPKLVMEDKPITPDDPEDPTPKEFDILISKIILGQGKELQDAHLSVKGTSSEGKKINVSWISSTAAKTIKLPAGKYTLIEDKAPLGYDIAEKIDFEVTTEGKLMVNGSEVIKLVMEDKQLEHIIKVSKINIAGEEIPGANIQIKDANSNLVHSWTSERNKTHEFKLLPGDYTFHEEAAPNGYLAVADIKFTVGLDGKISVQEVKGEVEYKNGVLVVTDKAKPNNPVTPTPQPVKPDVKTGAGDLVLIVTSTCLVSIFLLLTVLRKKQTRKTL